MTDGAGFDLAGLARHQLAELAGRVRRCGDDPAAFADIARAIVATVWDVFGERTPPVLAIVRAYRVRRGARPEIAASRTIDAAGDAPPALEDPVVVAHLASDRGGGFAGEAAASRFVAVPRELVLRYGVQAVVAGAAPLVRDEAIVLAIYARVAVAPEIADAFATVALAASVALAAARDVGADRAALDATRAHNLAHLLEATAASFVRQATALARSAEDERSRGDELERRVRELEAASAERLQRTQRAMLNVIEDLREARTRLEERVAERTRELQRATEQAQLASRAKDEFLAMLSHELRNPLAPILTALELMRLRGGDALARERAVIERQTQHLAALVEDLLDVSRIARGKVELRRDRVRLADVIAKAIETAAPLFEQQRHELVTHVPGELVVDGDPARLAQVFGNLLSNAAKYTDPGGRVALSVSIAGGEVVVEIADNGRGISADMLPRVFELFAQERQNLDRSRGGLGLGLTIARNLVELHAGRIHAASAGPGRGSTFTVHLPATTAELAAATGAGPLPGIAPAPAGSAGSVLVVDDNSDAAFLLAELLDARGYTTRVAFDPLEALRLAGEFVPDVALLDIGLPVMDGYELARRLRALPRWHEVKLLALSGYGNDRDRARSREAGFDQHLVKPIDLPTLERYLPARG